MSWRSAPRSGNTYSGERGYYLHRPDTPAGKEDAHMEQRRQPDGEKRNPMEIAMEMTIWQHAKTDPQGSWTGTPADPSEIPVQDADDL